MQFRILGPFEVVVDSRVLRLGGPKQRALLALLLLHRNQVLETDRVVRELWGDTPPATAVKTIQVYLSRLRRTLGDGVLERHPLGYLLKVGPEQLDAERFERLVVEAATTDPPSAARALREALSLWRGAPLADFAYEAFAAAEIARLEDRRLHATAERIEADLALGHHAEVVSELETLVAGHPLRERFWGQLMLALYRSDRQADALAAYRTAGRMLREELGLEPSPSLRRLEHQILDHDPALDCTPQADGQRSDTRDPLFVGRDRELGALVGGLTDVMAGRGRLFLVSGEPGVGKTRLVEELASEARARGALALEGRCWEAGGAPAYWPWVHAIRGYLAANELEGLSSVVRPEMGPIVQLVPELRDLVPAPAGVEPADSAGARFRLFEAIASFLAAAAARRPLLLVLADIHAADTPSLLMLQFIASQVSGSRLLMVATYRDVDPPLADPLASALAELTRQPITRHLALSGLDSEAVARYIEASTGRTPTKLEVSWLHRRTEGNPLFMVELVRLLASRSLDEDDSSIPEGVRTVFRRRLRHLPDDCRDLLGIASVLGSEFSLGTLELVAGPSAASALEVLEPAIESRLLEEVSKGQAPVRLRFSHGLIRDVLYDELPAARRIRLHRQAGEALEELYALDPGPHLAELAHHFAQAAAGEDRGTAVDYARRAGKRAISLLAYEEAARLYMTALRVLEGGRPEPDTVRCEILLALGDARSRGGDEPGAKETFRRAAACARACGAPQLLARAALGYGGRFLWARAGNDHELVQLLREALAALEPEPSTVRVRLLGRLAGALRDQHEPAERDALTREALESARGLGDAETLAYALEARITATLGPDDALARLALARELVGLAGDIGDPERLMQARWSRLVVLLELGEHAMVWAELEEAASLADKLRQPAELWVIAATRATLALFEGQFEEGERLVEETAALGGRATQASDAAISHSIQQFTLGWQRGDYDQLANLLERAIVEYPARPMFRCMLALVHAERGAESRARNELQALAENRFAAIPRTNEWLLSLGFLAEVALRVNDASAGAVLYDLLLPYGDRNACTADYIVTGSVWRSLGLAALAAGWPSVGIARLDQARAANASVHGHPWVARAELDLAAALLSRDQPGDAVRAHELLASCASVFRALDMRACLARAEALNG